MAKIKGEPVLLHVKEKTGVDDFGSETYEDRTVLVENVLIGQPTSDDVVSANLMGKHVAYTLGIPKGDHHAWEDTEVEFWGKKYRTIGIPMQGMEGLMPLSWGKNVMVERYE